MSSSRSNMHGSCKSNRSGILTKHPSQRMISTISIFLVWLFRQLNFFSYFQKKVLLATSIRLDNFYFDTLRTLIKILPPRNLLFLNFFSNCMTILIGFSSRTLPFTSPPLSFCFGYVFWCCCLSSFWNKNMFMAEITQFLLWYLFNSSVLRIALKNWKLFHFSYVLSCNYYMEDTK